MPKQRELDSLVVRPVQFREERYWNKTMNQHHYLGFRSLVGKSMKYMRSWKMILWPCLGGVLPLLSAHPVIVGLDGPKNSSGIGLPKSRITPDFLSYLMST